MELELIRKDGSTVWAEVRASFLRDQAGNPVGILGISRDISDRMRAERELKMYSAALEATNQKLESFYEAAQAATRPRANSWPT